MTRSTVALLRWLGEQFPTLRPYSIPRTLIGHRNIAPKHRANCPGPNAGLAELAIAANGSVADPFELWGSVDKPEGQARGFAIAQTWLKNKATLGACLRGERYDLDGKLSRAIFQRGEIRYLSGKNIAEVLPYPAGVTL